MSLLAVIPARLGATRLPRKPLRNLGGAPLVVRVWERVAELGVAERCVVATDHDEIAAAVRQAGGEAVLTRADHPSGTDRVAEVAGRAEYRGYDAVLNVQGDEPFVSAAVVRGATEMVTSGRFPLGTAACPADEAALAAPDVVKVVAAEDGRALYFSRAPIPFLREPREVGDAAARDALARRHVGIYAYAREALARWVRMPVHPLERVERLEQLRPLAHGVAMGVALVDETPAAGIDTEADLAAAARAWPAWEEQRRRARRDVTTARDAVAAPGGAPPPYAVPDNSRRPLA